MKYFSHFVLAVMAVIFAASCDKNNFIDVNEAKFENDKEVTASHLVSSTFISSESAIDAAKEAIKLLPPLPQKEVPVSGLFSDVMDFNIYNAYNSEYFGLDWSIDTYTIEFNTVDAYNQPIVLSGDIAFLNENTGNISHKLSSVYVFNNTFCCDDPAEGSFIDNSTMVLRTVVLPLRALYNELAIYPHNQGAGYDKGKHYFTPTEYLLNARQNIDLELAALEFIETKGVEMSDDYYSQVVGTSNGSASALAFQYLLEAKKEYKEAAAKIRLNGTYCGEGCYFPSEVFIDLMRNRDNLTESGMYDKMPYIYVAVICGSYDSWKQEFNHTELEAYFSDEFLNYEVEEGKSILDVYFEGEFDFTSAAKMKEWGFSMANIINEDLYDDGVLIEDSKPILKLKKALQHNEAFIKDWTPQSPLLLIHSQADEMNPYSDALAVYNNLGNGGRNKNVNFKSMYLLDHSLSCPLLLIDCLLKKNPAQVD